jgi:molybdopterin-guanine dinucleotide biosynthesis protein A
MPDRELTTLTEGIAAVLRAYDSARLVSVEVDMPTVPDFVAEYDHYGLQLERPGPSATITFRFDHGREPGR